MNKHIYKGLLYAEKQDYQRAMTFVKAAVKELEREPVQDEKIQAYIIYAELLYKVGVEKKALSYLEYVINYYESKEVLGYELQQAVKLKKMIVGEEKNVERK